MPDSSGSSASTLGLAAVSGCFAAGASVFGKLGMSAEEKVDGTVASGSSGGDLLNELSGVEVSASASYAFPVPVRVTV